MKATWDDNFFKKPILFRYTYCHSQNTILFFSNSKVWAAVSTVK